MATVIRLIAFDVDGTLIGATPEVGGKVRTAITAATERGVYVTLATARSYHNARRLAGMLGLNAPLIVHAGALVRDPASDRIIFERPVPFDCAVAVAAFCDERRLPMIVSYEGRTYLRRDRPPEPMPAHVRMPERIAPFVDRAPMSMIVEGDQAIRLVHERFDRELAGRIRFSEAYNGDGSVILTLTAAGADKGTALGALCAALAIGPEETMAVGDADVDVPMFAVAGLTVAMGNAPRDVQEAAAYVAPPVDEDGAAWALRRFVLGG